MTIIIWYIKSIGKLLYETLFKKKKVCIKYAYAPNMPHHIFGILTILLFIRDASQYYTNKMKLTNIFLYFWTICLYLVVFSLIWCFKTPLLVWCYLWYQFYTLERLLNLKTPQQAIIFVTTLSTPRPVWCLKPKSIVDGIFYNKIIKKK